MIVVVPMAGRGSRYSTQGYEIPKPLIPIAGKPMLWYAFQSLRNISYSKIVFVALQEHEERFAISDLVKREIVSDFEMVLLPDVTEGQLCTVMAAEQYFAPGEDLLIAASDTYVVSDICKEIRKERQNCEGIISVANLPGERWSFAKVNNSGIVTEVAEKVRISDHASTGLYYFSNCSSFVREAKVLIDSGERTKGEFYVIPLYNKFIAQGNVIKVSIAREMWDLGTPEAKKEFESHLHSKTFLL